MVVCADTAAAKATAEKMMDFIFGKIIREKVIGCAMVMAALLDDVCIGTIGMRSMQDGERERRMIDTGAVGGEEGRERRFSRGCILRALIV